MSDDKRGQKRVLVSLPISVEGQEAGHTRDLSAAGVFFETDLELTPGSRIRLTLEFDSPGGKLLLQCVGEVVRLEKGSAKSGVAVRILESKLERSPGPR